MTPEQIQELKDSMNHTLREGIETHVNGKIRTLTAEFKTYVKEDMEWKERADPALELVNNVKGFGRVFVYLLGVASAIFAVLKYLVEK